jgi:hypothetical protein
MVDADGPCPSPGAPHAGGGTLVIESGGPGAGPVTASNANNLSERLAKALGVSGDRVRQAMLATVHANLPAVPAEPMASIAQQLGKTPAEACAAFFDPQQAAGQHIVSRSTTEASPGHPAPHTETVLNLGGKPMNLNSASPDELSGPAQRLGVSPERLLAAMRASVPSTPPPPPPSEDEIIKRLASNLGMSQDQVRAVIKEVEGNSPFYFVVPLPGLGR